MAWNVKKDMPMGSVIWGTGSLRLNHIFRLFIRNIRYLNTPSSPRLNTTISVSASLDLPRSSRTLSTHRPNSQFIAMDAIMIGKNLGAPKA